MVGGDICLGPVTFLCFQGEPGFLEQHAHFIPKEAAALFLIKSTE
jgi:hypothetical protein